MQQKNNNYTQHQRVVAVLYQGINPPIIDGIRKPMKPGGYSDSGADIAYNLRELGIKIVTPKENPDARADLDWVFPDTADGINSALARGANVLWANTILFHKHPLEQLIDNEDVAIVGQIPTAVQCFDDKWLTNELLRAEGLNLVPACLLSYQENRRQKCLNVMTITVDLLELYNLHFPLVLKPVRGRGSQGVVVVNDLAELKDNAKALLTKTIKVDGKDYTEYGNTIIVEQYLAGTEITITVMPPGSYYINHHTIPDQITDYWSLPVVKRFNHKNGIAPYSGITAVTHNSSPLSQIEKQEERYALAQRECEKAARLIAARAPIRIDCRANADDDHNRRLYLFDVNMKPNMTGPGRPGRSDQDNLSAIAAKDEPVCWHYQNLLINMLNQAWPASTMRHNENEVLLTEKINVVKM